MTNTTALYWQSIEIAETCCKWINNAQRALISTTKNAGHQRLPYWENQHNWWYYWGMSLYMWANVDLYLLLLSLTGLQQCWGTILKRFEWIDHNIWSFFLIRTGMITSVSYIGLLSDKDIKQTKTSCQMKASFSFRLPIQLEVFDLFRATWTWNRVERKQILNTQPPKIPTPNKQTSFYNLLCNNSIPFC